MQFQTPALFPAIYNLFYCKAIKSWNILLSFYLISNSFILESFNSHFHDHHVS